MLAAAAGHADVTLLLLQSGAAVDAFVPAGENTVGVDSSTPMVFTAEEATAAALPAGYTALMCACCHGRVEAARVLLSYGADPSVTVVAGGETAKDIALARGGDDAAGCIAAIEAAERSEAWRLVGRRVTIEGLSGADKSDALNGQSGVVRRCVLDLPVKFVCVLDGSRREVQMYAMDLHPIGGDGGGGGGGGDVEPSPPAPFATGTGAVTGADLSNGATNGGGARRGRVT